MALLARVCYLRVGFVKEIGTGDWGFAVTGLIMLLFEVIWEILELWIRKAMGHFKS